MASEREPETPGALMKRLPSERGRMSQEALAPRIREGGYPISTSAITRIERGVDRPKPATAAALDAGGAVVTAFGYVTGWVPPAQYAALARKVDELYEQVQVLAAEVGAVVARKASRRVVMLAMSSSSSAQVTVFRSPTIRRTVGTGCDTDASR